MRLPEDADISRSFAEAMHFSLWHRLVFLLASVSFATWLLSPIFYADGPPPLLLVSSVPPLFLFTFAVLPRVVVSVLMDETFARSFAGRPWFVAACALKSLRPLRAARAYSVQLLVYRVAVALLLFAPLVVIGFIFYLGSLNAAS